MLCRLSVGRVLKKSQSTPFIPQSGGFLKLGDTPSSPGRKHPAPLFQQSGWEVRGKLTPAPFHFEFLVVLFSRLGSFVVIPAESGIYRNSLDSVSGMGWHLFNPLW
jgi:hypothetical protein